MILTCTFHTTVVLSCNLIWNFDCRHWRVALCLVFALFLSNIVQCLCLNAACCLSAAASGSRCGATPLCSSCLCESAAHSLVGLRELKFFNFLQPPRTCFVVTKSFIFSRLERNGEEGDLRASPGNSVDRRWRSEVTSSEA